MKLIEDGEFLRAMRSGIMILKAIPHPAPEIAQQIREDEAVVAIVEERIRAK